MLARRSFGVYRTTNVFPNVFFSITQRNLAKEPAKAGGKDKKPEKKAAPAAGGAGGSKVRTLKPQKAPAKGKGPSGLPQHKPKIVFKENNPVLLSRPRVGNTKLLSVKWDKDAIKDLKLHFARKYGGPTRNRISKELLAKTVYESITSYAAPGIDIEENWDPDYAEEAVLEIPAEARMVGGKKGCRILRKEGIIPGIIVGSRYPDIAIQVKKRDLMKFVNGANQEERITPKTTFFLVIQDRRYLVSPKNIEVDPITLDPIWIQWGRLDAALPKNPLFTVKRPKTHKPHFTPQYYLHPHIPIFNTTKIWNTPERIADRKRRRDMHIHDYLGLPR